MASARFEVPSSGHPPTFYLYETPEGEPEVTIDFGDSQLYLQGSLSSLFNLFAQGHDMLAARYFESQAINDSRLEKGTGLAEKPAIQPSALQTAISDLRRWWGS